MLKGREIALTLRSSWIMNVVSINVCIINHISTNWTSVEPVGLSDMETGLDYCLCFRIKDSRTMCSFLCGGWYTGGASNSLSAWVFFLTSREQEVIVLAGMSKYLFNFTRKGKENEEEMQAGSGVVFTYLFHCVSQRLLFSLLKQYSILSTCGQGHNWPFNSI